MPSVLTSVCQRAVFQIYMRIRKGNDASRIGTLVCRRCDRRAELSTLLTIRTKRRIPMHFRVQSDDFRIGSVKIICQNNGILFMLVCHAHSIVSALGTSLYSSSLWSGF